MSYCSIATAAVVLALSGRPMFTEAITRSMVFYPERGQQTTPRAVGLDFEEVWLQSDDGVRTQAWWIPAKSPRAVLVAFHGNAGTMAHRLPFYKRLHDLSCSLLTAEYRGYGDSSGTPSEKGLYADAEAALVEARRRAAMGTPIVAWGRSLGGAVAIYLAHSQSLDGLIAESTFTSLPDMAALTGIPFARTLVAYDFDSLSRIRTVKAPILLVHGEADELVPFAMGERLRDAALAAASVTFHAVARGEHNSTWLQGGRAYFEAIDAFITGLRDDIDKPSGVQDTGMPSP